MIANSLDSYTTALGRPASLQERKTAQLNRALAYLKNGAFDAALVDTECLTSSSDAPEKALYRAGQALYELGRFSECQDILQSFRRAEKRHLGFQGYPREDVQRTTTTIRSRNIHWTSNR